MSEPRIQLLIASKFDILPWSYGRVTTSESLYDPRIFGAREDSRCECGKYSGAEFNGLICDRCGVKIAANSAEIRKKRIGHMQFQRPFPHPLDDSQSMDVFPVAPIAFRRGADGRVNELGTKYERLLKSKNELEKNLPAPNDYEAWIPAVSALDDSETRRIIRDIIGNADKAGPDPSTIFGLLSQSILTLDPGFQTLLRCCALVCEIETTI